MRPQWYGEWSCAIVGAIPSLKWHSEWRRAIPWTFLAINAHRNACAPFGAHSDLGMARPMLGHAGYSSACTGAVRCT